MRGPSPVQWSLSASGLARLTYLFFPDAVYLEPVQQGKLGWPADVLVDGIPDIESITDALKTGPYGRCVYECDNDVCDNQVRDSSPPSH